MNINNLIAAHHGSATYAEIANMTGLSKEAVRSRVRRMKKSGLLEENAEQFEEGVMEGELEPELEPEEIIERDSKFFKLSKNKRETDKQYKVAIEQIDRLRVERDAALEISESIQSVKIFPEYEGESESIAVLVCSDWHIEERVNPALISGLNEFSMAIATERSQKLFRKCVNFIHMYQQDTTINKLILALLGDFITNDIHDEFLETAEVQPIEAIIYAQNLIVAGIDYILDNTEVDLVIPCHSGNHARTTKQVHIGTEKGHSLEYFMYHNLKAYYRDNPRVTFLISEGYHSYVQAYDTTIRFHHGHALRFGGGVGGLFIPAYKQISRWNSAKRADLDIFGHFHQTKDGGSFYSNGSLIGYNTYALNIGCDYEPPRQSFFLINKDLGRTIMSPIHL